MDIKASSILIRMILCNGNTAAKGTCFTVIRLYIHTATIKRSTVPGDGAALIGKITCMIDPYAAAADAGAVPTDHTAFYRQTGPFIYIHTAASACCSIAGDFCSLSKDQTAAIAYKYTSCILVAKRRGTAG